MEEKIVKWGGLTYDLPSIYSEEVVIRSTAAVAGAKAGHLLFWNSTNKGYEAFATATDLTAKTGIPVVVLMEDVEIPAYTPAEDEPPAEASGEITAKAIISGRVYKDFIRSAGIDETALPDSAFSTLGGRIVFIETEDHTEGGDIA